MGIDGLFEDVDFKPCRDESPLPPFASFLTGSRVYGTPSEQSDIDLVVMLSRSDLDLLLSTCNPGETDRVPDYGPGMAVMRFERLNLIAVADEVDFLVWKEGTEELRARKPVTRKAAVELFAEKRKKAGR